MKFTRTMTFPDQTFDRKGLRCAVQPCWRVSGPAALLWLVWMTWTERNERPLAAKGQNFEIGALRL